MGLYWNPYGVVGSLGCVVGLALAVLVLARGRGRSQNRFLALLLACMAVGYGFSVGVMFAADDARTSLALQAVGGVFYFALLPVYVLFLSTLPTRWMAWARPVWVRCALGVAAIAFASIPVLWFDDIVAGVVPTPYARFDAVFTNLGIRWFEVQSVLTATLGIGVALLTVHESRRGTPARRQARSYAAAFIWFDVTQLAAYTVLEFAFRVRPPVLLLYTIAAAWILPIAFFVFLLLLAYGMLRFDLFELDLHIKAGLRRGLVLTPIAIAFFVASETLEGLLPIGSYWVGLAAAGVITIFLVPLQRGAHRAVERLMPHVQDTPAYRRNRAADIYRAAYESAGQDGRFTPREHDILDTLATQLGLGAAQRAAIHGGPPQAAR